MARDEIRPRIEDLFARMRADREAAVTTAREVLAAATDSSVKQSPEPTVDDGAAADASVPDRATTPRAEDAPGARAKAASRAKATSAARALDLVAPAARVTSNDDERRLQARDAVTEPLTGQLTRRLKRALQDEQNESLDRLRTSRRPAAIGAVLAARDDQAAPYRELAIPFLDESARAGASGSKYGPVSVGVDDLAAALAGDLASALRGRLEQALTSGGSEDLDLGAISERISSVYREWKGQKVERLALHYLVAAHERGCFLSHPEGTPLRWIVDDEGPCPDCEDNGLAGPTPRGEPFPTGQLHPPAHMGCRCLLTPTSS
jgi:hypothetical protein